MKYSVSYSKIFNIQITEAFYYYEAIQKNLAIRFLEEVEVAISHIKKHPVSFQVFANTFRQITIKNFPFVEVFEMEGSSVFVYQIFNTNKNPIKKINKLD